MPIDDRIPELTNAELATLLSNVERLAGSGTLTQRTEAERVLPLVRAELESRRASAPAKKVAAAKKVATPRPRKAKATSPPA